MKDAIPGATLDTMGRNSGDGFFTWRPSFDQGRNDHYAVTFVYASVDRKIEKIVSVKVLNTNRPPKLTAISDRKVKESEALTFKVEASDPDGDSLTLTATGLPPGAAFTAGMFTWTPTVGQAGNYSVKFKAFDGRDSDMTSALITVGNVDVPPPLTVKITSPARDTEVNFTPITILYTVNGASFQKKISLKDGKNKLFVDTTVQGRTAFDTLVVTFDTTAPNKPIVTALSPVNTRTPAWRWKSGDGGGSGRFRIKLDDDNLSNAPATPDTGYLPATDLSVGAHTLYVQERDIAGNWSFSGSALVRIDTEPPNPPVVSSANGNLTNKPNPNWTWVSGGQGDAGLFQAKLDSPDFSLIDSVSKIKSFVPTLNLVDGGHTLYVRERDSAGNWSKLGSCTLRVDTSPPSSPILLANPKSPLNSLTPSWDWISGGGGIGRYRFKLDNADLSNVSEANVTAYGPSPALPEGPHTLYVQETDSAGNWSTSGSREIVLALRGPIGNPGFSPGHAYDISLALAKDNTPIVAFRDAWNDTKASVMRLNGASWQFLGNAGFSSGKVFGTTLALDGSGTPYVAYQDADSNYRATVMKYSGSAWTLVGPQGFSPSDANELQIGILKNGNPFVTFRDASERGSALQFNGSAWVLLGPIEFPFPSIDGIFQTVSPSGTPFVVFIDPSKEKKLTCMKFNGTEWEAVGNAGFTPTSVDLASIAVDSKEIPYVAFHGAGNKASVMRLKGMTWEFVGQDGISDDIAQNVTVSIDQHDLPYIAFSEGTAGKLSVMRFDFPVWGYLGESEISSGGTQYLSMAFNSTGVPYIGFSDLAKSGNVTVMKTSFDQ